MKKETNKAVAAVIFLNNKVLAVSRKYDKTDFGLCGGKLEQNEDIYQAIVREVYEETGITILEFYPIFKRFDDDCETTTFYVKSWIGLPKKLEKGEVKWVDYSDIERGSFGKYNTMLKKILIKKRLFKKTGLFTTIHERFILSPFNRADLTLKNKYQLNFEHQGSKFFLTNASYYPLLLNKKHHFVITSKEYPTLVIKKKDTVFI